MLGRKRCQLAKAQNLRLINTNVLQLDVRIIWPRKLRNPALEEILKEVFVNWKLKKSKIIFYKEEHDSYFLSFQTDRFVC